MCKNRYLLYLDSTLVLRTCSRYILINDAVYLIWMYFKAQDHVNYPCVWSKWILRQRVVQRTCAFDPNGLYCHLHLLGLIYTIDQAPTVLKVYSCCRYTVAHVSLMQTSNSKSVSGNDFPLFLVHVAQNWLRRL